jgi:hypothetical protein
MRSAEELARDDKRLAELRQTLRMVLLLKRSKNQAKYRHFIKRWNLHRPSLENWLGPRRVTVTVDMKIIASVAQNTLNEN